MTKDEVLKKAYSQAMTNAAINHFDHDVDFMVMKTDMMEYARKNGVEIPDEELIAYIKEEMKALNAAMIDFSYNTRMMK